MPAKNKQPLSVTHPELASEWHPTKNGDLTPADVVAGSHKQVWWKCLNGPDHEWQSPPKRRTGSQKSGCPCCSNYKVSVTNSLASCFPEIAADWHPTKNGDITPADVVAGSNKKVWWKCPKGEDHEWETALGSRTGNMKSGCPFCSNKRLSATNSLAAVFPEIAAEWHPTKNGDLTPEQVMAGSHRKFWWKCPKAPDHEWQATLNNRTRQKSGCPCCSCDKVSITNSLAVLFPEIAAEWHPTKNGHLAPDDVIAGSHQKFWWKCPMGNDHEWEATLSARTGRHKSGCPCCRGLKVSVTNSLACLFPEIATEWHPVRNGDITPADVVAGSNKKVWWKCPLGEDHEWEATLGSRTGNRKSGCPHCNSGWTLNNVR